MQDVLRRKKKEERREKSEERREKSEERREREDRREKREERRETRDERGEKRDERREKREERREKREERRETREERGERREKGLNRALTVHLIMGIAGIFKGSWGVAGCSIAILICKAFVYRTLQVLRISGLMASRAEDSRPSRKEAKCTRGPQQLYVLGLMSVPDSD